MANSTPHNPDNQPPVRLPGAQIPSRIVVFIVCAAVFVLLVVVLVAFSFVYATMAKGYSADFAEMAGAALPW